MKTANKISRVFRLAPPLVEQLDMRSSATGITKTRILENALALYFTNGMERDMAKVSRRVASLHLK